MLPDLKKHRLFYDYSNERDPELYNDHKKLMQLPYCAPEDIPRLEFSLIQSSNFQ